MFINFVNQHKIFNKMSFSGVNTNSHKKYLNRLYLNLIKIWSPPFCHRHFRISDSSEGQFKTLIVFRKRLVSKEYMFSYIVTAGQTSALNPWHLRMSVFNILTRKCQVPVISETYLCPYILYFISCIAHGLNIWVSL